MHVFGPNFFGGGPPKFWDLIYHAEEPSDHVAKFSGDRPMELGDLVAKKTSAAKQDYRELPFRAA